MAHLAASFSSFLEGKVRSTLPESWGSFTALGALGAGDLSELAVLVMARGSKGNHSHIF